MDSEPLQMWEVAELPRTVEGPRRHYRCDCFEFPATAGPLNHELRCMVRGLPPSSFLQDIFNPGKSCHAGGETDGCYAQQDKVADLLLTYAYIEGLAGVRMHGPFRFCANGPRSNKKTNICATVEYLSQEY
jgi:hypothetical protein